MKSFSFLFLACVCALAPSASRAASRGVPPAPQVLGAPVAVRAQAQSGDLDGYYRRPPYATSWEWRMRIAERVVRLIDAYVRIDDVTFSVETALPGSRLIRTGPGAYKFEGSITAYYNKRSCTAPVRFTVVDQENPARTELYLKAVFPVIRFYDDGATCSWTPNDEVEIGLFQKVS